MHSEISAAFTITGTDLDPEEVTRRSGITPSKTWRLGDPISGKTPIRYQHNGWSLKSGLPLSSDLDSHIRSVLDRLTSGWDALVAICRHYDAELACVIYSYDGDRPAIHLDKAIVQRMAQLNAELDVDLYILD